MVRHIAHNPRKAFDPHSGASERVGDLANWRQRPSNMSQMSRRRSLQALIVYCSGIVFLWLPVPIDASSGRLSTHLISKLELPSGAECTAYGTCTRFTNSRSQTNCTRLDQYDVILRFLTTMDWDNVQIITGNSQADEPPIGYRALSDTMRKYQLHHVTGPDYANTSDGILRLIYNSRGRNIIAHCSIECIETLLHQANLADRQWQQQGHFTWATSWLLLTEAVHLSRLSTALQDIINVAVIATHAVQHHLAIQHDRTALMTPCESTLYSGRWTANNIHWVEVRKYGYDVRSKNLTKTDIYPNRQYGLNGKRLVVAVMPWPLSTAKEISQDGQVTYRGWTIEILDYIAVRFNFSYTLVEPPDGAWGGIEPDGSWTGLVGMLQRKEVDLVSAQLTHNPLRHEVIDFPDIPTDVDGRVVMFRLYSLEPDGLHFLLRPFSTTVWLCILASLPLGALVTWLVNQAGDWLVNDMPDHSKREGNQALSYWPQSLWFAFGVLMAQSQQCLPRLFSGRVTAFFWWLYCIVMSVTYLGNMVALVSVPKFTLPFNSLEELVKQNEYKFGTLGEASFVNIIASSTAEPWVTLWSRMVTFHQTDPTIMALNITTLLDKVQSEPFALVTSSRLAKPYIAADPRMKLFPITSEIYSQQSIGLQKNSQYREPISAIIADAWQHALIEEWDRRYHPRGPGDAATARLGSPVVSMQQIYGVFYILAAVLVTSGLVLVVECCMAQWRRLRRERL